MSNNVVEFFAWVERTVADGNAGVETACRAGCSWCCRGNVPVVTPAEQELVSIGLRGLDSATLEAAREKAKSIVEAGLESGPAMMAANRPCPMLDDNDRCRIYEHRPLACRMYGASTIEPGYHFGCDAIQMQLAISGASLVQTKSITEPFHARPDTGEAITLAAFLASRQS